MEAYSLNDFYGARLYDSSFFRQPLQNENFQHRFKAQAYCLRSGGLVPRSVLDHE